MHILKKNHSVLCKAEVLHPSVIAVFSPAYRTTKKESKKLNPAYVRKEPNAARTQPDFNTMLSDIFPVLGLNVNIGTDEQAL